MGIENLQLRLSGGTLNSDVSASTGGVMSDTSVLYQSGTPSATIPGVTIYDAGGNAEGAGALVYSYSNKSLTWTPPGASIPGTPVALTSTGRYLIRGSGATSGYLLVDVVSTSLSNAANYTATITIADRVAMFLPPVDKDTAYTGATEYFLYYINNASASTVRTVKINIETDTTSADTLYIAAIATKNTTELQAAASGHTYVALGVWVELGDMLSTDYWGIWIKRVTPALSVDGAAYNKFKLRISALT